MASYPSGPVCAASQKGKPPSLEQLIQKGRHKEAISRYLALLKKDPDNIKYRRGLAEVLSWNKDFQASITQYRLLLKNDPDNREYLLQLARVQSWAGEFDDSSRSYDRLLEESPEDRQLLLESARVSSWAGQFDAAIEKYQFLLGKDPNTDLKTEMAKVQSWAGRLPQATRLFEEVLEEDPLNLEALLGLAQVYHWQGKYTRARDLYQKVLLQTDTPEIRVGLGHTYREQGKWKKAQAEYEKALALDPSHPEARQGLRDLGKAQGPELRFRSGYYSDSADFTRLTYGGDGTYRGWENITLRAGILRSEFEEATGEDLSRNSFSIQGELDLGPGYTAAAGFTLHRFAGQGDTAHLFRLAKSWDTASAGVSYSHYQIIDVIDSFEDNLFSTLSTVDSIRQEISADDLRGEAVYRFSQRFTLNGGLSRRSLSDGNDSWFSSLRLTYQALHQPYLAFYYNFFWADFEQEKPLYWSPSEYQAHGLGGAINYTWKKLTLELDEHLFFQTDASAFGSALTAAAQFEITDRLAAKLTLFFFESDIADPSFHSLNLSSHLAYHF